MEENFCWLVCRKLCAPFLKSRGSIRCSRFSRTQIPRWTPREPPSRVEPGRGIARLWLPYDGGSRILVRPQHHSCLLDNLRSSLVAGSVLDQARDLSRKQRGESPLLASARDRIFFGDQVEQFAAAVRLALGSADKVKLLARCLSVLERPFVCHLGKSDPWKKLERRDHAEGRPRT